MNCPFSCPYSPGESLRLRYGVLLHAAGADEPPVDIAGVYEDYLAIP